nr:hypothetical protein [uncultured Blautia sp.]
MKNKKVILLLLSLTLLVGIVQPGTLAVFAEESAFTCDTESGFYAEASQPYIAPEVSIEEEPEEEPVEEPVEEPEENPVEEPAFTCDIESDFYAEASLLYAAPGVLAEEDRICTCNPSPAEGEEHQKDCPLYVEQTWQGEDAEIKYQIVGPENCGTLDNEKELLRLPVSSAETGFADENPGASGDADLYLISDGNLYLNGDSDMAIGSVPTAAEGFRFVGWYMDEGCIWPVEAGWVSDNRLIPEKTKNYGTADSPVMGYETATYYARFESDTADLIITKQNMDEGQSSIFDVTGPDGYSKRIVINGSSPVTIKGLKSGTYTVTEVTAWQHTAGSNSQSVTLQSSKSSTVCFTDNRSSHQWLSGNAYNRITFGN